jgi:hypothetical protein
MRRPISKDFANVSVLHAAVDLAVPQETVPYPAAMLSTMQCERFDVDRCY